MTVRQLYNQLDQMIKDEKGHFDLLIRVGDDERDLITGIHSIEDYDDVGFVIFDSINKLDWKA